MTKRPPPPLPPIVGKRPTQTEVSLNRAVERLLNDAWTYQLKHRLSEATVSRKLFGDARVLERLWCGDKTISVRRLVAAARRLRILKETK
jgi:hypothetical protein